MQKFLITNTDRFTGQAELVYNLKGTLCIIDASNTDMNAETIRAFKAAAPVSLHGLADAFKAPTVIVEADFEITFERFYNDYPHKRNRYKAEKLWPKLSETDRIKAWHGINGYKKYLNRNDWQNPMCADSYLSRREYETNWDKVK